MDGQLWGSLSHTDIVLTQTDTHNVFSGPCQRMGRVMVLFDNTLLDQNKVNASGC